MVQGKAVSLKSKGHFEVTAFARHFLRQRMLYFISWFLAVFIVTTCVLSAQTVDQMDHQIQGLIKKGEFTAASQELLKAIEARPKDANLYNLQGVVLARRGNLAEAQKSFEKAIEISPHFSGAYLNLGHLYAEASKTDPAAQGKALDVYERLLKFDPHNTEANIQAAVLLFQKGYFRRSLAHVVRLPAEYQEHASILSIRCGDLAGQGDQARASDAVKQLLHSSDLTEADALPILPVLAKFKNRELAVMLLEGLQARGLASFHSLRLLGLAYEQEEKLSLARSTLEKAARLRPTSVPVLIDLAQVADRQHDYAGALEYLAHARDLAPQDSWIHYFWGMVCMDQNLVEEAYRAFKKAVSLDPSNPSYNYAMGAVALRHGDATEAIPYFQKYCKLRPKDPRGQLALGVVYFSSGNDRKAQQVLLTVLDYPETAATAHYYLGRIASRKGNLTLATRELRLALQASPNYAEAYAELGLIYMKQKDYRLAKKAFQTALKLNPDSYTANLNLAILYRRIKDPRAKAQEKRFDKVKKERAERTRKSFWTIEAQPVYTEE